jgi:hypothetical protein
MRFLCLLLPFLIGCSRVEASTTDLPTLTVEMQADSARVIATWRRPCDAKGCADAYTVRFEAGSLSRTRRITVLADTFFVTRPAVGDSTLVSVVVTSLRRGIAGATRTATATIRNPDAPPPAVDSLRTDTLSALAAERDSFPTIAVRDSLGRTDFKGYPVNVPILLCAMERNRYTGAVRMLGGESVDADGECAQALRSYAAERSG